MTEMSMFVKPLDESAAVSAGVPDDLAERTMALLVVSSDDRSDTLPAMPGSVVLLGEGQDLGVYRTGDGRFSLIADRGLDSGAGSPVARGSVVGILKKFAE